MRGLAVLVMIQCHTFNSFTRIDLREGGPYVMTQFIGGMAAPLFLFMAGMTTAFQMESLERRESSPWRRWRITLGRAGYIVAIAFTFRFTNWFFAWPLGDWHEMLRVDILNCMGFGLAALAVASVFRGEERIRFTTAAGLLILAAAPLLANLDWNGTPRLLQEYFAPAPGRRFPLFPWSAYLAFGMAAGAIVKRAPADRMERLMQWSVLAGFGLVFGAQYFSNLPYSLYTQTSFWLDSPALPLIRTGIILWIMAAAYLWTEYVAAPRWSWMQALGQNSLMVYWIHVMLVYGSVVRPIKRSLSIAQAALATVLVTLAMVALSGAWIWWKTKKGAAPGPTGAAPKSAPLKPTGGGAA
jgi:uncharacterized membrane protein